MPKAPAQRFKATLEPVPHGGLFVVVPAKTAAAAGLKYGARVRGTVNGAPYRSSLMKYSGVFHLGVHKATQLSPAHKREHVKQVIEAKKPETRARRIAATVAALGRPE